MKKINSVYFWNDWFLASLDKEEQIKIRPAIIKKLNRGQIYLWNALNIYDDILDGSQNAKKLPLANNYFRHYLEIYYRLKLSNDFYQIFNSLQDDLERANQEEFLRPKLKFNDNQLIYYSKLLEFSDLKSLSRKSLTLSTGPLAILYLINSSESLNKVPGLINFFKYTLAAKQLADDAKDWLEDLKNGVITYPISLIIKIARKKKIKIDLENKPELVYILFAKIAPKIGKEIESLCLKARQEAKRINISASNLLILNIIGPLEKAVLKAQEFKKLLPETHLFKTK